MHLVNLQQQEVQYHNQVINAAISVLPLVHYLPLQIIQWCYLNKSDVATYPMDVYVSQVCIYNNCYSYH